MGGWSHVAQGHEVPRREEGGTLKGEGWGGSGKPLASPFAKCCPLLYLLEKACLQDVGLSGRVNKFAQSCLSDPCVYPVPPSWGECAHSLMTEFLRQRGFPLGFWQWPKR